MIPVLMVAMIACDVEQTEQAELPEVDVEVEEGQMPEYDVDWAEVDVSTRTKTVNVPKVIVVMEEEEVEVPYVDVDMPDGREKEERNITVETEVSEESHQLTIQEVYATEDKLLVISELQSTGQDLQDQTVRISDQLVLNAPEELTVKHYIVGEKPSHDFNNQYKYIGSRTEIEDKLQQGRSIYSR